MPRTDPSLVQAVLGKDYDSLNSPDLTWCCTAANIIMNRVVECAIKKKKPLTDPGAYPVGVDSEAEMIERLVAAHMYCAQDAPYSSRSTAGASGSFQTQKGTTGLEVTNYGKRALLLDVSGCLNAYDKRLTAHGFGPRRDCPMDLPSRDYP